MKIKTITCHDVYNAGASLQAYALATYLSQLGHEVQIINYKPDYLSNHYRLWGGVNPVFDKPLVRQAYCMAKLPGRLAAHFGKRKRAYDRFTQEHLPLTEKSYRSNEELKASPPPADIYFAGSDQIWNTLFPNGKDPAFYLDFAPQEAVRASYAASFATQTVSESLRPQVQKWLSGLDHVSVREASGLKILAELGIQGGVSVLDPVFLLREEQWSALADEWQGYEKKPYVLVYDFENSEKLASFARQLAQIQGHQVVSVLRNKFFSKNYASEGPAAFVSLVKHASAVVTNSFHALAFSLIFHKEVWIFQRSEGINDRMLDLAKSVGICTRVESATPTADMIDYREVDIRLAALRERSVEYIQRVLEGTG